jgi:Protein of unknown function (DUF3990)
MWQNGRLSVYHGCDDASARDILANGIDLTKGKPLTDFGKGFYTTTNLHQAKNWANTRIRRLTRIYPQSRATVISLQLDRNLLGERRLLCFVTEGSSVSSDYWEFVRFCRTTFGGVHQLSVRGEQPGNYDLVFGLVSIWPQMLVIKDCDQISFHTNAALRTIVSKQIIAQGTPAYRYLP